MKSVGAILFFLISPLAFGDFEFYRGARMMGMGGAGVAVVNDETALMVNPNGLAKIRGSIFTLFDPEVTSNIAGINPLVGTGGLEVVEPEKVYDELADRPGDPFYFKGQMFPSLVMRNFGFGVLGKAEILAQRNSNGTYEYHTQRDLAAVLGFNMRFWGGRIKVGFTGKGIRRREFFGQLNPLSQSLNINTFTAQGEALGADGGLTLTAPWHWLPALAIVTRDIGDTKFSGASTTAVPRTVGQSVDVGVAIFPIIGKYTRATLTMDYRDALNSTDNKTFMEKSHIGGEVNLWDSWFFRAGYGAERWTAGFEYANSTIQWQLATYAEPINRTGFQTEEDRRWILKFTFRQ